jgi:hypothetical protein
MVGPSPPLNLALLNIKHWLSKSGQGNILHFTGVPLLIAYGLAVDEMLTIGSSTTTRFDGRERQAWNMSSIPAQPLELGKLHWKTLKTRYVTPKQSCCVPKTRRPNLMI